MTMLEEYRGYIREIATGSLLEVTVLPVSDKEIKNIHKKDGWKFNWKQEAKLPGRQIFKLVIAGSNVIQGLISIELKKDEKYILKCT